MSNLSIDNEIKQLKKDIQANKKSIEPFVSGGRKLVTQAEISKADQSLKKMHVEWKRRKRGCMDIIDQICESAEMNRKDFIKKLAVETDEENKVVCPV